MKQIIYLGGKKAREYSGKPNPELYALGKHDSDYIEALMYYESYSSALPVVDVIGDCDWKKGEIKTEGVDYFITYIGTEVKNIIPNYHTHIPNVPIPKKQEGESQSDLWRALVCSVQIAAKEADKIDWNNDEEKELFIWEQIANQFTITRKS